MGAPRRILDARPVPNAGLPCSTISDRAGCAWPQELRAAKFPYAVQTAHSTATDMQMLSLLNSNKVCFIIVIEKGRL